MLGIEVELRPVSKGFSPLGSGTRASPKAVAVVTSSRARPKPNISQIFFITIIQIDLHQIAGSNETQFVLLKASLKKDHPKRRRLAPHQW